MAEIDDEQNSTKRVMIPGCVVMVRPAYKAIEQACMEAGDLETGGILIGQRVKLDNKLFVAVIHVSGPGSQALHQPASFAPDVAFAQAELDQVRHNYARQNIKVEYVGEWHKHPVGYTSLSAGDIEQAQAILQDPAYKLEWGELILPIAQWENQTLKLIPYYISRLHPQPVPIDLLVWDAGGVEELLREQPD